jgi:uncharacterized glyoxalase superfamily protein PhnB
VIFEDVTPILSVVDLARALAWYEEALGFARAWAWGDPIELASVCRERVELNLGQRGKVGPPGPSQVYLRVGPIDAVWQLAAASGAEIVTPIADRPYGMRDFSIRDESGNRLDFGEPIRAGEEPATAAPAADTMKVFLPAKDFAVSKRFYRALGFAQNWESPGLAEIELASTRLLLQDFYDPGWAGNFMIHVEVTDADAWAGHARATLDAAGFPETRIEGPRNEPWGYRVTYVVDPSGVLLRFSQPLARPSSGG